MSFVWNILLSFSNEELWAEGADAPTESCEPLDRINSWIPDGRLVDLTKPTYKRRAGYGMEANVYGGGYKHFDIEGFIEVVEAQAWKERSKVQLWIKPDAFSTGDVPFELVVLRPRKAGKGSALTKINEYLQSELRRRKLSHVSAVEAARWLDRSKLIGDSKHRPGLPLRELLRAKKIDGQRQEMNRRWHIDRIPDAKAAKAARPAKRRPL